MVKMNLLHVYIVLKDKYKSRVFKLEVAVASLAKLEDSPQQITLNLNTYLYCLCLVSIMCHYEFKMRQLRLGKL